VRAFRAWEWSAGPGLTLAKVEPSEQRPLMVALALGAGVGVLAVGLGIALVSLPVFGLAQALEPSRATGRTIVRDALIYVALPFGALFGLAVGAWTARWYRRGGSLPRE
jgi:hypothetical protein